MHVLLMCSELFYGYRKYCTWLQKHKLVWSKHGTHSGAIDLEFREVEWGRNKSGSWRLESLWFNSTSLV